MSAETQSNALKTDLAKAVGEAHAALDKAVEKLDAYLTKLQEENTPVPPVSPSVVPPVEPSPPQNIPVTSPPDPVLPTPPATSQSVPNTGETFTPDTKTSK